MFTPAGLKWLDAFRDAVDIAEQEMRAELGKATMDAILKGLALYGERFDTLDGGMQTVLLDDIVRLPYHAG